MTNGRGLVSQYLGRGGYRAKAGRKSSWQHPETQTIRVPKVLVNQLLQLARRLDNGEPIDTDTKSKPEHSDCACDSNLTVTDSVTDSILPLSEALVQAQAILRAKRSASKSLVRLLSVLYQTPITADDLRMRRQP